MNYFTFVVGSYCLMFLSYFDDDVVVDYSIMRLASELFGWVFCVLASGWLVDPAYATMA